MNHFEKRLEQEDSLKRKNGYVRSKLLLKKETTAKKILVRNGSDFFY